MDTHRASSGQVRAALPLLAFAGIVLLIGSNIVAIRLSNRELPPLWGAGARFLVAAGLFLVLMQVRGLRFPRGRSLLGSVLFGLTGIAAYFAFVYWGLVEVGAAYGQVLLSLVPLITFFLALAQGLERFRWPAVAGAIVTVAGIATIFHQQAGQVVSALSLLALLAAAVCAAQAGIILKLYPPESLLAANTVAMSFGAAILIALSVASGETPVLPARPETWAAFAFLSTIGTVGTFLLVMYLLRHWSASAASYQYVLAPVVALALAAIVLGERVGADFFVGGALVLSGVYLGAILQGRGVPRRRRDKPRRH